MDRTLQSLFYAALEKDPARSALAFIDDEGGFEWETYEDVFADASARAAALRELGLEPGGVGIVVLQSGRESALSLLATILAGGVPLMVAPPAIQAQARYSSLSEILKRIVRETGAKVVIGDDSLEPERESLQEARRETRFVFDSSELSRAGGAAIDRVLPGGSDLAALQLTSGTTGFPRVCVWRQRGVVAALDGMVQAMDLRDDDICLNWTPLYHDMGLVNNFFLCFSSGVPLALLSPQDFVRQPALWLRALTDTGATTTWSPNFGFALAADRVADEDLEGVRLEGVRALWNAAERIHAETLDRFNRRFRDYGLGEHAVKTNFGCAENVGGATFSAVDAAAPIETVDADKLATESIAVPVEGDVDASRVVRVVGVGRPYDGLEIQIRTLDGELLPDGHVGELVLDTPSRMEGYLGDDDSTERALKDGLLWTGDLAYKRGDEVFWVGRSMERINSMGRKFDPSDFEAPLLEIPELRPGCFAAFGSDDPETGSQKVVVVGEVRDTELESPWQVVAAVRQVVTQKVGAHVSEVLLVPKGTLAKTSSGKRRHRKFRQLYEQGRLQELDISRPRAQQAQQE